VRFFVWDFEKDRRLRRERGIGFAEIVFLIETEGALLDVLEHPNPSRYPGQRIFVVQRGDYAYLVPFVEEGERIVLKTIIPSRKATRDYLREGADGSQA
jgi:uncharacterized DUF497 family protein